MLGTNDHPGDYRSSGCSGCHVVYANDRDAGPLRALRQFGHHGPDADRRPDDPQARSPATRSSTPSPRQIPTSQCIICHMHPGTNMVMTYLGYIWWDNETDGEVM